MFSLCISTWRIRRSSSWHSSRSSHGSSMAGTSVVNQVDGATDTMARIGDRVQTGMVVVDGITTDPMVALERRFCLHRTMTLRRFC